MAIRVESMIFKWLHPSVAFAYYMGMLAFVFICGHPVFLLTMTAGVFALAFFCAGFRQTIRSVKFPALFGLLIGLLNPLLVHRGATILFYWGNNPVTLEAAVYGVYYFFVLMAVIGLFISFNRLIDQAAFLYLTARWLPRTAFVISMALYTMSRFSIRLGEFAAVQRVKGVYTDKNDKSGTGTFRRTITDIKTALLLFRAFTVRNLEEGLETAEVLRARDYGVTRRSSYRSYTFKKRDAVAMLLLLGIWGVVLFGYLRGAIRYQFYPRLQGLGLTPADGVLYAFFTVYVCMPFLYQIPLIPGRWRK